MTENQDYVFYPKGMLMSSKQPMKQAEAVVVGTQNYLFFVPTRTVGMFLVVNTIKTHQYFAGVSIEDGVRRLIQEASSPDELERSLIALLEDDEKYVHKISEKNSFKFRGFLGKHTLRMSTGGTNWTSIMAQGKGNSKLMRSYYGQ